MNTLINYLVNRAGLGIAVLGLLARPARAQFTDTVPPTLVSATFSPNPVDVTSDDASVTLSLHITDDLSGIDFAANSFSTYVQIAGPSGQYLNLYGWNFLCTGGVPGDLDTTWDSTFTVYKGTENGDWRLTYMNLYDRAGNGLYLDYLALGAFNPLSVLSFSDTTPPTVSQPTFNTEAGAGSLIDTSAGPQWIALQFHVTDDIAGFGLDDGSFIDGDQAQIFAQHPNGATVWSGLNRIDGTRDDGTWEAIFSFPQYSPAGDWTINLTLADNAKNRTSLNSDSLIDADGNPSVIHVFSDPTDLAGPTASHVTLSPITIDTSASDRDVTANIDVADDLSGVSYALIYLRSPSGAQQNYIYCYPGTANFTSGTLSGHTTFRRFSEAGTWKVWYVYLYDNVNNFRASNDPEADGLGATLNVILPSLDTDGTVDASGGTVTDAVFQDRASVTIPPGAVAGNTTAAIDVLADPLDVPLPTGFAGANTYYVNIHLEPQPNYPLPPPGLTVVLPLRNAMTPGTHLNLYRVNTTTGQLEAAIDVYGNPVVGTVDAGGLSATFTGISRLSTVVGLLPDPVISWSNPADIQYGTALSGGQLSATANVPGTFAYTPLAGTVLGAGLNQSLSVLFTPDDTVNYHTLTKVMSINVTKAKLKVIVDNETKVAGQANPALTLHYDGFVNGDGPGSLSTLPNASTTANTGSPAGAYDISASGAASDNYQFQYIKGTLIVLAPINLKPVAYQLVSSKRISATVYEYVYKFQIKNDSATKAYDVSAQLNKWPSQFNSIDGTVSFGNINGGQMATGSDTFTVRIDRAIAAQNSDLNWQVKYGYDAGGLLTTTVVLPLK